MYTIAPLIVPSYFQIYSMVAEAFNEDDSDGFIIVESRGKWGRSSAVQCFYRAEETGDNTDF
eukprot:SAG31_NODE_1617_length_7733_cov_6.446817_10_plen_62_part_00